MTLRSSQLPTVPADIEDVAGGEFMLRLRDAVARIQPMSMASAAAYVEGPEVSGGLDIEPDDI